MTNAVVDTLMDLQEGDRVVLEAQYYEWAPFEVDAVDLQPWTAPNDKVWIAKHIELEPTDGRGSAREFDVYPAASPPYMGSGYGTLTNVDVLGDDDDAEEFEPDECSWLERPADEIVDTSPIKRSLPEVLDAVEHNDTMYDINRRIAAPSITSTRRLLWELGLRDEAGRLLDDDVLEVRIGEMREVFC